MATANETLSARTPIGAALATGTDTLSYRQEVTFHLYARAVLPLDGYVFWVKSEIMSDSALYNASAINAFALNQGPVITQLPPSRPAPRFKALGSLHYLTDSRQSDDANYAANRVVFTSQEPLQDMNSIGPNLMYIGTFDSPNAQTPGQPRGTTPIRFAFSSRGSFYRQTDLYHYTGYAVYPMQATQIIDDPGLLRPNKVIVSNSLPFWLGLSGYAPLWPVPVVMPLLQFYPSMLVPDNLSPPYVSVRIDPSGTESDQSQPFLSSMTDGWQLAHDRVALTIYGANNEVAQDLFQSILQYSYDTENFGIMNMPVIRDEKEGQNELNTLAQKKTINFDVSYNQTRVRNIARQLIESCLVTVQVGDQVIATT